MKARHWLIAAATTAWLLSSAHAQTAAAPTAAPAAGSDNCAASAPAIAPGQNHVSLTDAVALAKAAVQNAQCQLRASGAGSIEIQKVDFDFQTVSDQNGSVTAGYILTLGAGREKTTTSETIFHYNPEKTAALSPRFQPRNKGPAPEAVLANAIAAAGKSLAEVPGVLGLNDASATVTLTYAIKKDGTLTLAPLFGLVNPFIGTYTRAKTTSQAITISFGRGTP